MSAAPTTVPSSAEGAPAAGGGGRPASAGSTLIPVAEVAAHNAASTRPIADEAHTLLSNALTTPTIDTVHDQGTKGAACGRVVIRDVAELARKRAAMVAAGPSKLQVIADFDRTLSAFRTRSGAMCAASHQLLESCVGFDKSTFLPAMDKINTKYFALEISHDITEQQRAEYMVEWWQSAHALLLAQGIRFSAIEQAVRQSREEGSLELRQGAREFLHTLNANGIPCLVFSAGVRETISQTLVQEKLMLPNMHIIGNRMFFDDTGLLTAFDEECITSSSKTYAHVHEHEPTFHALNLARRNVILLGDNIGDANMAHGLEDIDTCIKVGLLHDNVEGRLEKFKEAFDIVLLSDADFAWTQELVDEIIASAQR